MTAEAIRLYREGNNAAADAIRFKGTPAGAIRRMDAAIFRAFARAEAERAGERPLTLARLD